MSEREIQYGDVIFVPRKLTDRDVENFFTDNRRTSLAPDKEITIMHYKHYGICSYDSYPRRVIHYVKEGEFRAGFRFGANGIECEVEYPGVLRETSLQEFLDYSSKCYICEFNESGYKTGFVEAKKHSGALEMRMCFSDRAMEATFSRNEEDRRLMTPEETVNRAREAMKGNIKWRPLVNNCEHFAMWCKTGVATSEQTDGLNRVINFFTGGGQKKKFPMPDAIFPVTAHF